MDKENVIKILSDRLSLANQESVKFDALSDIYNHGNTIECYMKLYNNGFQNIAGIYSSSLMIDASSNASVAKGTVKNLFQKLVENLDKLGFLFNYSNVQVEAIKSLYSQNNMYVEEMQNAFYDKLVENLKNLTYDDLMIKGEIVSGVNQYRFGINKMEMSEFLVAFPIPILALFFYTSNELDGEVLEKLYDSDKHSSEIRYILKGEISKLWDSINSNSVKNPNYSKEMVKNLFDWILTGLMNRYNWNERKSPTPIQNNQNKQEFPEAEHVTLPGWNATDLGDIKKYEDDGKNKIISITVQAHPDLIKKRYIYFPVFSYGFGAGKSEEFFDEANSIKETEFMTANDAAQAAEEFAKKWNTPKEPVKEHVTLPGWSSSSLADVKKYEDDGKNKILSITVQANPDIEKYIYTYHVVVGRYKISMEDSEKFLEESNAIKEIDFMTANEAAEAAELFAKNWNTPKEPVVEHVSLPGWTSTNNGDFKDYENNGINKILKMAVQPESDFENRKYVYYPIVSSYNISMEDSEKYLEESNALREKYFDTPNEAAQAAEEFATKWNTPKEPVVEHVTRPGWSNSEFGDSIEYENNGTNKILRMSVQPESDFENRRYVYYPVVSSYNISMEDSEKFLKESNAIKEIKFDTPNEAAQAAELFAKNWNTPQPKKPVITYHKRSDGGYVFKVDGELVGSMTPSENLTELKRAIKNSGYSFKDAIKGEPIILGKPTPKENVTKKESVPGNKLGDSVRILAYNENKYPESLSNFISLYKAKFERVKKLYPSLANEKYDGGTEQEEKVMETIIRESSSLDDVMQNLNSSGLTFNKFELSEKTPDKVVLKTMDYNKNVHYISVIMKKDTPKNDDSSEQNVKIVAYNENKIPHSLSNFVSLNQRKFEEIKKLYPELKNEKYTGGTVQETKVLRTIIVNSNGVEDAMNNMNRLGICYNKWKLFSSSDNGGVLTCQDYNGNKFFLSITNLKTKKEEEKAPKLTKAKVTKIVNDLKKEISDLENQTDAQDWNLAYLKYGDVYSFDYDYKTKELTTYAASKAYGDVPDSDKKEITKKDWDEYPKTSKWINTFRGREPYVSKEHGAITIAKQLMEKGVEVGKIFLVSEYD